VTIHIAPYFLRLHLPGAVLEDDASSASYDPGPGTLTVVLTKETAGQDFPDLDLLAKLLAPPPKEKEGGPSIEVISSEDVEGADDENLSTRFQALDLDAEKREILEGNIFAVRVGLTGLSHSRPSGGERLEIAANTLVRASPHIPRQTIWLSQSALWLLQTRWLLFERSERARW
jgi:hypothetical protein